MRLNLLKFLSHALDMRRDRTVVDNDIGFTHQLLAIFHMAGITRQRMHNPELGQGQVESFIPICCSHLVQVDLQLASVQYVLLSFR